MKFINNRYKWRGKPIPLLWWYKYVPQRQRLLWKWNVGTMLIVRPSIYRFCFVFLVCETLQTPPLFLSLMTTYKYVSMFRKIVYIIKERFLIILQSNIDLVTVNGWSLGHFLSSIWIIFLRHCNNSHRIS